jgi:hypothetical protein
VTFFDGDPATGTLNMAAIDALDGLRFVRFRVALRSNHLTNQRQFYSSLRFSIAFGGQ